LVPGTGAFAALFDIRLMVACNLWRSELRAGGPKPSYVSAPLAMDGWTLE